MAPKIGNRNVDLRLQKPDVYRGKKADAAVEYITSIDSPSLTDLNNEQIAALTEAFAAGADTARVPGEGSMWLVQAFIAGRRWGMASKGRSGKPMAHQSQIDRRERG